MTSNIALTKEIIEENSSETRGILRTKNAACFLVSHLSFYEDGHQWWYPCEYEDGGKSGFDYLPHRHINIESLT